MIKLSLLQNLAVTGNRDDLPRDKLAAAAQSRFRRPLESAAAWHLHPYDRDTLDVIVPDNRGQLFAVIDRVQLGAADDRDFAAYERSLKLTGSSFMLRRSLRFMILKHCKMY